MKIYIVEGEHPYQDGSPRKVTFSADQADAFAAELVAILWRDVASMVDDGFGMPAERAVEPAAWQADLRTLQAIRYADQEPKSTVEGAMALLDDEHDRMAVLADLQADVWIDVVDVEAPASITLWQAFADTENGTEMHVAASERLAQDWLLDQFGADRDDFETFMATGLRFDDDGRAVGGATPTPVEQRDLNEFIRATCIGSGQDNWGLESIDIPVPGVDQPIRVAVNIKGGMVQSVEADAPCDVLVLDYDIDGESAENLFDIPQDDGSVEAARAWIETPAVDGSWIANAYAPVMLARGSDAAEAMAADAGAVVALFAEGSSTVDEATTDLTMLGMSQAAIHDALTSAAPTDPNPGEMATSDQPPANATEAAFLIRDALVRLDRVEDVSDPVKNDVNEERDTIIMTVDGRTWTVRVWEGSN
jgi:hypothetical protein